MTEQQTETLAPEDERPIERSSFTIPEFCERNAISHTTYVRLKKVGQGPDELRVLSLVRITRDAEAKWQHARTYPSGAEAKARARMEAASSAHGRMAGKLSAASARHVSKTGRRKMQRRRGGATATP